MAPIATVIACGTDLGPVDQAGGASAQGGAAASTGGNPPDCFPQDSTITVQVLDAETSEPLCDAVVAISSGSRCEQAEPTANCLYSLAAMFYGTVLVTAERPGYAPGELETSYPSSDGSLCLSPPRAYASLALAPDPSPPEVVYPPVFPGCPCEPFRQTFELPAASSCVFSLARSEFLEQFDRVVVFLDRVPLSYQDDNGWEPLRPDQIELLGAACEAAQSSAMELEVWMPCPPWVPE